MIKKVKVKLVEKLHFIFSTLFFLCILLVENASADVKSDIKSIKNGSAMKKDAFKSATKAVYDVGGSGVTLLRTAFVVLAIISTVICGIGWIMHKNSQKYQENKDWLVRIAGACAVCFCAGALVTLFYSIANSIS